jgi:hypothetical protein
VAADVRADIAADHEATVGAHQPGDNGNCAACPRPTVYPCWPLLLAEDVADRLAHRPYKPPSHPGTGQPEPTKETPWQT